MTKELGLIFSVFILLVFSIAVLLSISPNLFPAYFIYVLASIILFGFFSWVDFDIWSVFYKHLYILSILFLLLPLLIGQITRGTIRWISIGALTLQPSELVKPFLILFFAKFINIKEMTLKRFFILILLLFIPLILVLLQPSLGVGILIVSGFLGTLVGSSINKKIFVYVIMLVIFSIPLIWFLLAGYQKARILSFISFGNNPYGRDYQSIQATIAVGSGKFLGRGLGQGVQTQLSFLPERNTDFIFASIGEEMGLLGAILITAILLFLLNRVIRTIENAQNITARSFACGIFLILFAQIFIHISMNMGMLPITGIPLPLVSAGGSSLVSTMIMLGMILGSRKRSVLS